MNQGGFMCVPLRGFLRRRELDGDELVRGGGFVDTEGFWDCRRAISWVFQRLFKFEPTLLAGIGRRVPAVVRAMCIATAAITVIAVRRAQRRLPCSVIGARFAG